MGSSPYLSFISSITSGSLLDFFWIASDNKISGGSIKSAGCYKSTAGGPGPMTSSSKNCLIYEQFFPFVKINVIQREKYSCSDHCPKDIPHYA